VSNPYTGLAPYEAISQAAAIQAAPIPQAAKKTALRRLYESALAQDAKAALSSPVMASAISAARGGAEGAGIGYLLGMLAGGSHGKYTDLAAGGTALAGLVGSVIPGNPVAEDFRNAGIAGATVLAYRRAEARKRAESGTPAAHGLANEDNGPDDPLDHIVQIAKKLGISGP
jgi:hypothetical protein